MLNVAIGGSAANDASEVAVKPAGLPSGASAVITETPAARRRKASLNAETSSVMCDSGVVLASMRRLCHDPGGDSGAHVAGNINGP